MIQNRRRFLKTAGLAGVALVGASTRSAWGQSVAASNTLFVETSVLELYDAIQGASGVTREPAFAEARLGELQRSDLTETNILKLAMQHE